MKFSAILLCAILCFAALSLGSAQSDDVVVKIYAEDCSKFYRCVGSRCELRSCLQGFEFNPVISACDYVQPVRKDCKRTH